MAFDNCSLIIINEESKGLLNQALYIPTLLTYKFIIHNFIFLPRYSTVSHVPVFSPDLSAIANLPLDESLFMKLLVIL